ncbi:MAG: aminotransferase class V-fold PLP-dependent enzyme [Mycobacterium sp.]|nr:aminotransferase class V-fold PLP-dependent enzyme [Mycobacterium sp.]
MSGNPIWGEDWDQVRRLWLLDPEVAHCNHGSFGAVPGPVLMRQNEFRARMAANPMRWFHRELPGLVTQARTEVAGFLGASAEGIAFVTNVSTGISAIAQSLALRPGDEVLSTNHVYGSVSLALDRLCARTGAVRVAAQVPVECGDDEVTAIVAEGCTEKTALVVIDQITSATARRFPVEAVAKVARQVGAAVLIDGAHAPGMLPVDVPQIGADFWVGNLHKWPCAPAGTGVLWVAEPWRERILPLVVSGNENAGFPAAFDRVGTNDLSAWLAAPSALQLLGALGWDRIRTHNESLVHLAQSTVAEILGVPPSDLRHDAGLSLAVVPLPRGLADSRAATRALQDHMAGIGVEMQIPNWNGRGTIRLSAHVYNSPSDYERMALGVRDYLRR